MVLAPEDRTDVRCPACNSDGPDPCAFCRPEPTMLESRLEEFRIKKQIQPVVSWQLNGRRWLTGGFAPGEILEVTEAEMAALRHGVSIEEILEARRG